LPEDQILLLLRDKHGIPYSEIASALRSPEESLKVKRQQALRTLEEWLWDNSP
jgi:DNA-directed RNA polymerase specialized sigma24 family protein